MLDTSQSFLEYSTDEEYQSSKINNTPEKATRKPLSGDQYREQLLYKSVLEVISLPINQLIKKFMVRNYKLIFRIINVFIQFSLSKKIGAMKLKICLYIFSF